MSGTGEQQVAAVEIERGLRLLERAIDGIPHELARIRERMAAGPTRRGFVGYPPTLKVHALLARLGHEVHTRTQRALDYVDETETAGSKAQMHFTRPLRRRALRLRNALAAYRDTLHLVLEEERRKEAARLAAHQRALGFAVAALAGVTAMPLLIGELDGDQLTQALSGLPGVLKLLGALFESARPWLAFLAAAGAIGVLVLLAIVLVRVARPPQEYGTDPVAVVGRSLMPLKRLAHEARSRAADFPDDKLREMDDVACDVVVEALDRLAETDERAAAGNTDETVDAFVIRAELGARRPVPLPFPRALTLLRFRLEPKDPDAWVDAEEVPPELERLARAAPAATPRELAIRLAQVERRSKA